MNKAIVFCLVAILLALCSCTHLRLASHSKEAHKLSHCAHDCHTDEQPEEENDEPYLLWALDGDDYHRGSDRVSKRPPRSFEVPELGGAPEGQPAEEPAKKETIIHPIPVSKRAIKLKETISKWTPVRTEPHIEGKDTPAPAIPAIPAAASVAPSTESKTTETVKSSNGESTKRFKKTKKSKKSKLSKRFWSVPEFREEEPPSGEWWNDHNNEGRSGDWSTHPLLQ